MKILVLNYEYPPIGGGAAPVSKDLAIELSKEGNRVVVLTMKYGDEPYVTDEHGVTVYRLPCLRRKKASCSPVEQLTYLLSVRDFIRKNKEIQQFDVCHAHFVIPTAEVARYIKKKYGIPYIITAHGSDVEGHNKKTTMLLMHRLLRGSWRRIVSDAYKVVSPSIYLMERMKNNYEQGKYSFISNGINYELFHKLNDVSKKQKKILVMGRIQRFKNVQFIVEAFSKIKGYDEWSLEIVGDGPYRKDIDELIERLGIQSRVHLLGWLDNKSKPLLDALSSASIYISASQFENCPMAVIESVVAGCYPLVSNIPAHKQMLPKEHLFALDDGTELVEKMRERMALGECNSNIDMRKYDWKVITAQYKCLMDEAVKSR